MNDASKKPKLLRQLCFYLYVLLSVYLLIVCLRIEILNYRAGGILPRRNTENAQNPKWRYSLDPLTNEQIIEEQLHKDVIRFGLLQYPLILISIIASFIWLVVNKTRPEAILFSMSAVFTCTALIFLLYRDYFGSLGW